MRFSFCVVGILAATCASPVSSCLAESTTEEPADRSARESAAETPGLDLSRGLPKNMARALTVAMPEGWTIEEISTREYPERCEREGPSGLKVVISGPEGLAPTGPEHLKRFRYDRRRLQEESRKGYPSRPRIAFWFMPGGFEPRLAAKYERLQIACFTPPVAGTYRGYSVFTSVAYTDGLSRETVAKVFSEFTGIDMEE